MADLNNYSVIGRMTRDIDDRAFGYTNGGTARLNISIAVNDGYGEKSYTNFFDVVIWGKTAENVKPYLGKGKQICINGRLRQDRWDGNDGAKHSRVCIVAETVQLLGGRDNGAGSGGNQQPAQQQAPEYDNGGEFSEDIPF
ncbi:MAG: single-stranded DNA-binding protein [Bacteroidaceae bacterium]|nr:single-stranded DNA-binding protein [Bacteroidaceae bacterium]